MVENRNSGGEDARRGKPYFGSDECSPHAQSGDTTLFETSKISIKETKHGFQYYERSGRNSIALFLIQRRQENEQLHVLMRWQRSVYGDDRDSNDPAPITGSLDMHLSIVEHAVHEAYEEAGYRLQPEKLRLLTTAACSTQGNEIIYLYACDITGMVPIEEKERVSWKPLSFLRSCQYWMCQLGYFLIQEMLSQQEEKKSRSDEDG